MSKDNKILTDFYTLIYQKETSFRIIFANENHPIFKAHFPTNAIVPGFILLDISAEVLGIEVIKIIKVKFLKNIAPLSALWFDIHTHEKKLKIRVTQNKQKVAELTYEKR